MHSSTADWFSRSSTLQLDETTRRLTCSRVEAADRAGLVTDVDNKSFAKPMTLLRMLRSLLTDALFDYEFMESPAPRPFKRWTLR